MNVSRVVGGPAVVVATAARVGVPGFTMPGAAAASPSALAGPVRAGGLDAMLALQEQAAVTDQATARDRQSRRRGQALLAALSALQHALLANGDAGAALQQMTALLTGPAADAPELEAAVGSLSLRASIELARRGW